MSKSPIAVGFHLGVPSRSEGLRDFLETMASHGQDLCLFGANEAGMLAVAQSIADVYGVEAWLAYRKVSYSWGTDVPSYGADAEQMALRYWDEMATSWPGELDPKRVWAEWPNEPNKDDPAVVDWLGWLAYYSGQTALRWGRRYLSPGWAAGNPEPQAWESRGWLAYLELCQDHPDQLGVSLHEYTLDARTMMGSTIPWMMGRVKLLNEACEKHGIKPPTVFMSEWGWGANEAPGAGSAMSQIDRMVRWYAANTPNVRAAAIWALDRAGQWADVAQTVNGYMGPLANLMTTTEWPQRAEDGPQEPPGEPMGKHKAIVVKIAQEATYEAWEDILSYAYQRRHTMTASHDDMMTILRAGNEDSYAVIFEPDQPSQVLAIQLLEEAGLDYEIEQLATPPLVAWPTDYRLYTQMFGANPANYQPYGLPGHEGVDIKAPLNSPIYAVAAGQVLRAGDTRSDGTKSNYGHHVILQHPEGPQSIYGHLASNMTVKVGDQVQAGQLLGYSGNSGNSSGPHLHLTLKLEGYQHSVSWPEGYMDPAPLLEHIRWAEPHEPLQTGWLWADGLETQGQLAVVQYNLNMRAEPSPSAARMRVVLGGETARLLGPQENGYSQALVHDPDPAVDMGSYFMPPAGQREGDIVLLKNNWGQGDERSQVQWDVTDPLGSRVLQVKNGLYEARRVTQDKIYLEEDTSPGGGQFYRVESESGWLPRYMRPGQVYSRAERVSLFNISSCQPVRPPYSISSDIKLEAIHPTWRSPHGVMLQDVAQLTWLVQGHPVESYFYAPHLGLVGWSNNTGMSSGIAELVPRGLEPNPKASLISCS